METRSLALQCLKAAIKENKFSMFESQFNAIKKEYPQDLLERDHRTGKTLLHLVLDHPNDGKIAHYLISAFTSKEFISGHKIIFAADNHGRTALWYAAKTSCTMKILQELLELGAEYEDYAWLSKADKDGRTVLHECTFAKCPLLLEAMKKSSLDINKIINLVDKDGYTPLYDCYDYLQKNIAHFSQKELQNLHHFIADLINNGAKLFLPDNKGRRPLDIHFELPFEHQQAIFLLLDKEESPDLIECQQEKESEKGKEKENQTQKQSVKKTGSRELILNECKAYLDDRENHPNPEGALQFYLRTTARHSLLSHILAHLEYDKRMPARSEFEWQEATYRGYRYILTLDDLNLEAEISPGVIIMHKKKEALTAYWLEQGVVAEKTMDMAEVKEISAALPDYGVSRELKLIKAITLKYGCPPQFNTATDYSSQPITTKLNALGEKILRQIPYYLERCGYTVNLSDNDYHPRLSNSYQQDVLANNRVLLGEFVTEMEASLEKIKLCEPAKNFALQILGVIAMSLSFMAYLSAPIASGIVYADSSNEYNKLYDEYYHSKSNHYNDNIHSQMLDKRHNMHASMTALITTIILGLFIPALGIFIFMKCCNVKDRINHKYWDERTNKLEELVTQLESLGKKPDASNEMKNVTTTLRSKLTSLQSDQYLKDVERIFKDTIKTLKTLQGELNRMDVPLSLFFRAKPDVVIEIPEAIGERQPLLNAGING